MPSQQGNTSRSLLDQAGRRLLESLETRLFNSRTERFNRLVLLLINAAILTLLILPGQQFLSHVYKAGDVASASIKATQDYLLEDAGLTEKKRAEAEKAAPYVYDFNPSAAAERYTQFEQSLDLIRRAKASKDPNAGTALRESLNDLFGIELSQTEIGALGRIRRDDVVLNEISRILDRIYSAKIVSDRRLFTEDSIHGVVVVNRENNDPVPPATVASYIELEDAVRLLNGLKMAVGGTSDDVDILRGLIRKILHPNLTFNRDATASRKKEARESVKPVLFQVKRGEMIVREGERIRDDQALKLRMIDESRRGMNRFFLAAGIFGILVTTFYFPYRFARKNIRKFNPSNKDLLLLSYITIVFFIILKVGLFLTTAMGSYFPVITSNDYFYLFPFAVGAMLVRIVLNSEIALVYCGICAPLMGVMFESSLQVSIYALMAGIVGAHGVRQCKDRGTIYIAGLKVSVVCVILALTFQILADNVLSLQTVYCLVFAFASGIISAAMVSATVPILETVFQYVTDIKLLELANLNSPVLRELMVKAPGTYHHSVLVGNLVEAAAEAINANPLLARVAAYYHDIGKLSKPMYFIENVASGENKHDKLAPSMSALVLTAHVKEGAEIAKENRLGTQLIDIIKQSHGTSLITFFFQKAKAQAAEGHIIEERDFRYPGPKPQTREAGLVMLADCVEAASRTLNDPTPARIQGMVQKIINNIFIDGQLDECELTLKNLHEIAKSFNCILTGIYHHRIDYPEPAYKGRINGGKKIGEDNNREPAKTPPSIDEAHKKGGGEDIKRLGITR